MLYAQVCIICDKTAAPLSWNLNMTHIVAGIECGALSLNLDVTHIVAGIECGALSLNLNMTHIVAGTECGALSLNLDVTHIVAGIECGGYALLSNLPLWLPVDCAILYIIYVFSFWEFLFC